MSSIDDTDAPAAAADSDGPETATHTEPEIADTGLLNTDELLKQFQRLFVPDFDVGLYHALNSDDSEDSEEASVAHIRIRQTVAEINELSAASAASSMSDTSADSVNSTPVASSTSSTIISSASSELVVKRQQQKWELDEEGEEGEEEAQKWQQEEDIYYIPSSTTSSSSMYAIRTPSPLYNRPAAPTPASARPMQHATSVYSISEGVTITEMVEVHRAPSSTSTLHNRSLEEEGVLSATPIGRLLVDEAQAINGDGSSSHHNNNNTSCSLSSTLTDSRTVDQRTPIIV